jgi:hypothetical protein
VTQLKSYEVLKASAANQRHEKIAQIATNARRTQNSLAQSHVLDVECIRLESAGMKQAFSSPDSAGIGLAQSILDAAGIACEVRNDGVSKSVPGAPFNAELWVLRDADYEVARRFVRLLGAPDFVKPE